ncbi:hypothetical protein LSH36_48g08124 [Paralvinella palmiformis]|uniref:Medium-chain acyl-CoA ligase ACSF2, mitochondrial n=1 Tax=Paralvinella palmiformis TaxID=53620 RepID=A0AAD9K710_9ANNE|nr:hypothetical protein LSH36_48g08124 [Paralvinella palmiformis]
MAAALCRKMLSNNLRQKFADYSAAKVVRFVDIYRNSKSSDLIWSYLQGPIEKPLIGSTIGKLVQSAAEKYGNQDAYVSVHQKLRYSFEDLLEKNLPLQSDQLAAGLMTLGLTRGDRVGIWAPNIMEWILTQYATARAGLVLVSINPAYRISELEHALNKVGVKSLIAMDTFKTSNYYKMLEELIPGLALSDPYRVKSERFPDLHHIIMIGEHNMPGTFRFNDVLEMATNETTRKIYDLQNEHQFDDVISIQFTSGTTGSPKAAALSHHNLVNNSKYVGEVLDYDKVHTRIALPVPMFHCFGMVLGSLTTVIHGSTVIMPSAGFDPFAALQAAEDERCRSMYGTPTMFIDMIEAASRKTYNLSSLSTGIMGGASCPSEVSKKVMNILNLKDITIAYGTTENSPLTFQTTTDIPLQKKLFTVGKLLPQCEAKLIDEHGRVTRIGQAGELCIRGYCVMQGYWNDPEKTREVIGDDRWYKTGDVAVMDKEGYLKITGRIKDVIIRGGENIYPAEVEQFLYQHPKIVEVQVVGVPDKRMGEEVCAWIKLKDNEAVTAKEIKEYCAGKMSHFKIPRYIQFVDEFPKTITGKIQKFKIREEVEKYLWKLYQVDSTIN